MACLIQLASTGDTVVSTDGCNGGIDFRIAEDVIHKVAAGEIIFQSNGTTSGSVEYLTNGVAADPGAAECFHELKNLIKDPTYSAKFNTDTRCRSFRLTVDEATMFAMNNEAHLRIGLDDVGLSLGSTVSIAPTVGVNSDGGGLSTSTIIIIVVVAVALILAAVGGVFLYKRLKKKRK
jgi:hypothetical protein